MGYTDATLWWMLTPPGSVKQMTELPPLQHQCHFNGLRARLPPEFTLMVHIIRTGEQLLDRAMDVTAAAVVLKDFESAAFTQAAYAAPAVQ